MSGMDVSRRACWAFRVSLRILAFTGDQPTDLGIRAWCFQALLRPCHPSRAQFSSSLVTVVELNSGYGLSFLSESQSIVAGYVSKAQEIPDHMAGLVW